MPKTGDPTKFRCKNKSISLIVGRTYHIRERDNDRGYAGLAIYKGIGDEKWYGHGALNFKQPGIRAYVVFFPEDVVRMIKDATDSR